MDMFNIGNDLLYIRKQYYSVSRVIGRTRMLLNKVKSGDKVIFINQSQAKMFENLCKPRGLDVKCIVVDPEKSLNSLRNLPEVKQFSQKGKTYFDHVWIEHYYENIIKNAMCDIELAEFSMSERDDKLDPNFTL